MHLSPLRRFTAHFALHQAATALAGAFIGAYLLRSGLTLPAALLVYAGLYAARVGVRAAVLPLVRRVGYRGAMALGAGLGVLQFPPLLLAENPAWLVVWVATVSFAEATYWPVFHAAAATLGEEGQRGREIAERQVVGLGVSVLCPLLGGWLLGAYGPAVDFGVAACFAALSVVPLTMLGPIQAGPVPTARESVRSADPIGTLAFAADGWICAGLGIAWPMVLFSAMGERYEALGMTAALGAVVGAASGLLSGRCIDRGGRRRLVPWVASALAAGIALRAAEGWVPVGPGVLHATGAAIGALWGPVLMSVLYDRARRSGSAYRYQLAAETGWDVGACLGCVAAASVAWGTGVPSLALLPAVFGVAAVAACVWAAGEERERVGAGVRPSGGLGLGGGAAAPAG
ncbi:hypothetical protein GCM10009416_39870 [Craurococcus roseus]|uniref:MFS transporter n=1 Tax=Craurococcus roseus TaxID=77585 RepID=A0ABP3R1D0_9PROT